MSLSLSISIKEDNYYLATGIKYALLQHFSAYSLDVRVNSESDTESCDIAIFSPKYLNATNSAPPRSMLIVLSPCVKIRAKLLYEHSVFCHYQPISQLMGIIEQLLKGKSDAQRHSAKNKMRSDNHTPYLTPRQHEVVELLSQGLSIQRIAVLLNVSNKSVSYTKRTLMNKLELQNLAELHRWMQS